MEGFNLSLAKKEIQQIQTITEKLNYWKTIIEKNVSEPLKTKYGNDYLFKYEAEKEQRKILTELFGANYELVSPLLIPEPIYKEHFEKGLENPEFTYWFLQFNALNYFDIEIMMKRLPEKLKTPISEIFIKGELKKLNDFEQKAENDLFEQKFNIDKGYIVSNYAKEIEYIRIKAEHYKTNPLPFVQGIGNPTVILYAEHIYLKKFLENQLNKNLPPHQTETKTNPEQSETLSDLITHKNRIEIIESVKIQYRNIKGKRLKLLLIAFQDLDLLPKERNSQKFHNRCKNEFNWNIASYNAMNDYNYNEKCDKEELNSMKEYLKTLIKQ